MTPETNALSIIDKPDTRELSLAGQNTLKNATGLKIQNQMGYDAAAEILRIAAANIKAIKAFFTPLKRRFDALKEDTLLTPEKEALAPNEKAREILEPQMLAWKAAENARREAEALKLQKVAEEAERKRWEAEAKAAATAAAKAAAEGDLDAAAAAQEEEREIIAAPVEALPVVTAAPVEKAAGISTTGRWVADLVDATAFVTHVLATPNLMHLIPAMAAVAQSEANERARRQREMFSMIGWKCRLQVSLSVRS